MISFLLKLFDPMRLIQLHRMLCFYSSCEVGHGFKTTERANIFVHDTPKSSIQIGPYATIDGTVEVYCRGKFKVGKHFFLGRSRIYCANSVEIGDYVLVSDNVTIMDSNLHPSSASGRRIVADEWCAGNFPDVYSDVIQQPVRICDDVWIGFGCCILKGVTIGQGSIIGAGSVVTSDVPPWSMVAGSPAKIVRMLHEFEK
jgi:acetyltransferase-like isoleucine patch superfamily enzyme